MKNRWVRLAVLAVGLPAIVLAGWVAYGDIQDLVAPPWWAVPPAMLANLLSLWCSARSWEVLFGESVPRPALNDAFFTSQLMKYTPVGGVAQAVGQAALARTDDVGMARAGTAMLVSKLTMVIGGGVFGPMLALANPALPPWFRLGLLATPAVIVFGRRDLMSWALAGLKKVLPRTPDQTILPTQREMWTSVAWAVPGLGFAGVAFALLAVPAGLGVSFLQASVGFSLAWVVGFLVIPIPSGLGVREAALGLMVGGDPAAKLVAAVLFRGVAIATEGLMFGAVKIQARRLRRPDPSAGPADAGPAGRGPAPPGPHRRQPPGTT